MRSVRRFVPKNSVVRWVLAAFIVLIVGVVGLSAVFSDLGPGEVLAVRILWVSAVLVVGGVLIGLLLDRRWYLAVAESWGPVLWGALLLLFTLRGSDHRGPGWVVLALCLLAAPAAALFGGFLGWRILGGGRHLDQRAS